MNDKLLNEYTLLYRLGVTANYTGFLQTAYAIRLCAEEQERLILVTKCVYPDVARRYHTSWKTVERNIRTINQIIWHENRPLLEQLAHRPLKKKPCTAQLLAILSAALLTAALPAGDAEPGEYRGTESTENSCNSPQKMLLSSISE